VLSGLDTVDICKEECEKCVGYTVDICKKECGLDTVDICKEECELWVGSCGYL